MHLGNLTLTKMQPKSAEKPRVRIGVVSVSMGLKREQYFIGHTWSPYFPRHGEDHMRTSVTKFSNQKIWNAKNLQRATETVLRKECREILTNTFDSGATSG